MRPKHRSILALVTLFIPALALGQGAQAGPAPAIEKRPRPAIGSGPSTVVLRLPFNAPGCYASGAALGTRGEQLTVTRATAAVYADPNAALQTCAANQFRVQGFPAMGALIEPAATNLRIYSQDLSQWSKTSATVTANAAAAPDGTSTATKVVANNGISTVGGDGAGGINTSTSTVTGAATYAFSVWAKPAEVTALRIRESAATGARVRIDLGTGAVAYEAGNSSQLSAGAVAYGNGWWLISGTRTTVGGEVNAVLSLKPAIDTGNGTSGIYLWGGQIEQRGGRTSLVATTSATASRSADQVTYAADIPATNGGAWCRGGTWTPVSAWSQIGTLWSAGSGPNSASLGASGSNLVFTVTDASSGTKTVTYSLASLTAGSRRIFACTRRGTLGLYVGGISVGTAAGSGTGILTAAPILSLGTNTSAALLEWRSCSTGIYARGGCR